ncbi:MAG: hypothetical protein LBC68_03080 [Prevotellaceae bacterium]|jgi:hypothetical protein|nr:hypothetical protein [Prevotellaceae bacterium]
MKTIIELKDDQHPNKKAVITVEKGGQKSMEFFPACENDDKDAGSYADFAKKIFNSIIENKI